MRKIDSYVFETEKWNHPDKNQRKLFVWIHNVLKPSELIEWIEDNCTGRYYMPIDTIKVKSQQVFPSTDLTILIHLRRVWFENKEDATLFSLMYSGEYS